MKRTTISLLPLLLLLLIAAAVVTPALAGSSSDGDETGESGGKHRSISFRLSGAEIPGGGDADGRGSAHFRLRPRQGSVCFEIQWKHLDGVVSAAHIHKALPGAVGPHHIDLFNDEHFVGHSNRVEACVQVEDGGHGGHGGTETAEQRIRAVIEDPEGYYLNVHTSAFPQGAIRGQLGR